MRDDPVVLGNVVGHGTGLESRQQLHSSGREKLAGKAGREGWPGRLKIDLIVRRWAEVREKLEVCVLMAQAPPLREHGMSN